MNHKARLSAIAVTAVTSLTLLLTGCGGSDDGDAQNGTSAAARSGNCPDKHSATVPNGNDFGGQVTIDLCKTPKTSDGTALKWDEIRSDVGSGTLTLNVNLKSDAGMACYKDSSKCLPQKGNKLPLVCQTTGINGDPQRFYAVLMTGKLFDPTVLMDGSTHKDSSKTSSAEHFTNSGDTPVGYVKAESVKAPEGLPKCDGTLLHSQSARMYAATQGGLPITQ